MIALQAMPCVHSARAGSDAESPKPFGIRMQRIVVAARPIQRRRRRFRPPGRHWWYRRRQRVA